MEIFSFSIPLSYVIMFALFVILSSAVIIYDEINKTTWDNLGGKDTNENLPT